MVEILPVYAAVWNDSEGCYEECGERVGFKATDGCTGEVIAYGESESEAFEAAMEALWGQDGERGMPPASSVVAR